MSPWWRMIQSTDIAEANRYSLGLLYRWRSQGFGRPGLAITMTAPDKNYELKEITIIELHLICLNNLKFVESRKSNFPPI